MRRQRRVFAKGVLSGVALAALAGCVAAPSARPARVGAASAVVLPIATRVALQVDPAMPDVQTIEFRGATWQYGDAQLMQEAAARVFSLVFQEVETQPATTAPAITLQLNGSSSLNPEMNEYYANATVTVFPGADTAVQPIASIAGAGQASLPSFVQDGIAQAYEGAFRQIVELLLADPHFVASLREYRAP